MEFARPIDSVDDTQSPSFFDLLAQNNFENLLVQLIKPSFINSKTKTAFFYGFKAAIDLGMLAGFGGIASEVVYGLERTSRRKWLLYLVTLIETHLIPFLSEIKSLPFKIPESLKKLTKLLDVIVKLAYITSDCKSFSLLHFLTGIIYKHSSTDVYERNDIPSRIVKTILITGQLAIFLLQSGVFDKLKNPVNRIVIPSTPPNISQLLPKPHPQGYPVPQRAGICPLCLESWKNPVALSSGFVYCQKCIKNDKTNWKICPVTRTPIHHFIPLFL